MTDLYRPGSNYVQCDRTGFKIRVEDARREWNGQLVDKRVFERRHPQDFVRSKPDKQGVAVSRPRQDLFVTIAGVLYSEDGDILQDENGSALLAEA